MPFVQAILGKSVDFFWCSMLGGWQLSGGETGIRTLETIASLHTFQACAFDHSATSP
jgi:hypothetical protein